MKSLKHFFIVFIGGCLMLLAQFVAAQFTFPFQNPDLPVDQRVQDLVSRLTVEEKVQQMMHNTPAIPRLGVPAYNWWNEALHGVARSGVATVFPQAIGLAATFNDALIHQAATAISDEARIRHRIASEQGYHLIYGGLTFWAPNINIFRDPRWGRGQETYGEDPFLTSRMGVAFVKGMQGDDPRYLKTAACAKHYAVHSGPEKLRHEFNATASRKDLWETYLPAFKALVDAGVESIMCAYNSFDGAPCCGNTYLLQEVLRNSWNFKGHILSDCWAIKDFYNGHKVSADRAGAAAYALKHGVSLNCGDTYYPGLLEALDRNLVTEKGIDSALVILLRTRFRLGLFDPQAQLPWSRLKEDMLNSPEHVALAKQAADQSMVLLKNNGVLPLKNNLGTYFVTGPFATSIECLLGNYYGVANNYVTFLEGITNRVAKHSQIFYRQGILPDRPNVNPKEWSAGQAGTSDATILFMGINGLLEGEEGEAIASPYLGDRLDYNIPQNQIEYLRKLRGIAGKKPIVAVVTGGSPMNLAEVHGLADAVVLAWYPGEQGGNALADILFGNVNPSGRLPITFPKSLDRLPPFEDYNMKGRTYKYMADEDILYPFGFGLSFSKFSYSNLRVPEGIRAGEPLQVEVTVTNTGNIDGEEVAQLYVHHLQLPGAPQWELKDFRRIYLTAGASKTLRFTVESEAIKNVVEDGTSVYQKGSLRVAVGGAAPFTRAVELGQAPPVLAETEKN